MNENWTQDNVTAPNSQGTVGLFGYEREDGDTCPWIDCEDEYYFYMKFVPFAVITGTMNAKFRLWFQIGDSTSDWHGVEIINTTASISVDTDLEPVSSTNSNFASNANFDDDSEFRGKLYVENGKYEVEIWRFIPRWE